MRLLLSPLSMSGRLLELEQVFMFGLELVCESLVADVETTSSSRHSTLSFYERVFD